MSRCRLVAFGALAAALAVTPAPANAAVRQRVARDLEVGSVRRSSRGPTAYPACDPDRRGESLLPGRSSVTRLTSPGWRTDVGGDEVQSVTYPSLPNYVALTSGRIPNPVAHRDCLPLAGCMTGAPNIFRRARSWRVYAESMPAPCGRQKLRPVPAPAHGGPVLHGSPALVPAQGRAPRQQAHGPACQGAAHAHAAGVLAGRSERDARHAWGLRRMRRPVASEVDSDHRRLEAVPVGAHGDHHDVIRRRVLRQSRPHRGRVAVHESRNEARAIQSLLPPPGDRGYASHPVHGSRGDNPEAGVRSGVPPVIQVSGSG